MQNGPLRNIILDDTAGGTVTTQQHPFRDGGRLGSMHADLRSLVFQQAPPVAAVEDEAAFCSQTLVPDFGTRASTVYNRGSKNDQIVLGLRRRRWFRTIHHIALRVPD